MFFQIPFCMRMRPRPIGTSGIALVIVHGCIISPPPPDENMLDAPGAKIYPPNGGDRILNRVEWGGGGQSGAWPEWGRRGMVTSKRQLWWQDQNLRGQTSSSLQPKVDTPLFIIFYLLLCNYCHWWSCWNYHHYCCCCCVDDKVGGGGGG